jgi:hypothetical protein
MRNNLTPTVVADKNGKITTVHKKLDTNDTATSKTLPAPVLQQPAAAAAPVEIETYDDSEGKRLFALMEAANKQPLGMDKWVFAVQANNKQMKLFADLLEKDEGFWEIIAAATSSSLSSRDRPSIDEMESIALIYDKDAYTEFPHMPKARKAQKARLRLAAYRDALIDAYRIKAIQGVTTRREAFNLGALPDETVDEVRAYVKFHSAIQDIFPKNDLLIGELFGVVLRGEHSPDEVLSVVQEHHTVDVNTVLGVLNGSSPAVAKGWL